MTTQSRFVALPGLEGIGEDASSTLKCVEDALSHWDPTVREEGLKLLCVSRQTSKLPTLMEFTIIQKYLPMMMKTYCHRTSSDGGRSRVTSLMKTFLRRVHDGMDT